MSATPNDLSHLPTAELYRLRKSSKERKELIESHSFLESILTERFGKIPDCDLYRTHQPKKLSARRVLQYIALFEKIREFNPSGPTANQPIGQPIQGIYPIGNHLLFRTSNMTYFQTSKKELYKVSSSFPTRLSHFVPHGKWLTLRHIGSERLSLWKLTQQGPICDLEISLGSDRPIQILPVRNGHSFYILFEKSIALCERGQMIQFQDHQLPELPSLAKKIDWRGESRYLFVFRTTVQLFSEKESELESIISSDEPLHISAISWTRASQLLLFMIDGTSIAGIDTVSGVHMRCAPLEKGEKIGAFTPLPRSSMSSVEAFVAGVDCNCFLISWEVTSGAFQLRKLPLSLPTEPKSAAFMQRSNKAKLIVGDREGRLLTWDLTKRSPNSQPLC